MATFCPRNTPTYGYPQPCDEHEDADRLGRCGRR
eukprot:gene22423-biopygen5746